MFTNIACVRDHHLTGRCPEFDPDRPILLRQAAPHLLQRLQIGDVQMLLDQADTSRQLTLERMLCDEKYNRAADCMGHLMRNHSDVWQQATPLLVMLQRDYNCGYHSTMHRFPWTGFMRTSLRQPSQHVSCIAYKAV